MADLLTEDQIAEFKDLYCLFDRDADGNFTANELGDVMRAVGMHPTDASLRQLIDSVDGTDDGAIDFKSFLTLMASKISDVKPYGSRRAIDIAFKIFDFGDGQSNQISRQKIKRVLDRVGVRLQDKEIERMILEAHNCAGQRGEGEQVAVGEMDKKEKDALYSVFAPEFAGVIRAPDANGGSIRKLRPLPTPPDSDSDSPSGGPSSHSKGQSIPSSSPTGRTPPRSTRREGKALSSPHSPLQRSSDKRQGRDLAGPA